MTQRKDPGTCCEQARGVADPVEGTDMAHTKPCATPGCAGIGAWPGRGYCTTCRFWQKVTKSDPNGCWLWAGTFNTYGYGVFNWSKAEVPPAGFGHRTMAHRYSYWLLVGPIPEGLQIDHLCRVTACVNPEHLEPVTGQVNVLRGQTIVAAQAAQTHCLRGHEFTPENTWTSPNGNGRKRNCRTCHKEKMRIYRAAKQAQRAALRVAA